MDVQFLIIGMESLVGIELARQLTEEEASFTGLRSDEVEYSNSAVSRLLKKYRPEFVFFANEELVSDIRQGIRDSKESNKSDEGKSESLDSTASQVLASACEDAGIPLIQLSSNEVFEEEPQAIFTEKEPPNGTSERAKLLRQAEASVTGICSKYIIVRVAWVFSEKAPSVLQKCIQLLREESETLQASSTRSLTPTPAEDIANAIIAMAKQCRLSEDLWGIYHYTGSELSSLFDFIKAIGGEAGQFEKLKTQTIESDDSARWQTQIAGSSAVMSSKKIMFTFGIKPKPWRQGLSKTIRQLYTQVPKTAVSSEQ